MLENRSCSMCDGTGLSEKGICTMCKGRGHTEVLKRVETIQSSKSVDVKKFILSISKFTTPEQLSDILSDYLGETNTIESP